MQQTDTSGMARTGSGLIVPAGLADQSAAAATPGPPVSIARDMDGRRRVTFTNAERKTIDKAIRLLRGQGIGFIAGCVGARQTKAGGVHLDGSAVCGTMLVPVDRESPDAGFACNCTRVHFLRT